MINKTDFTKLNISFPLSGTRVSLIEASYGALTFNMQAHMHSFYELHIISAGRGSVIIDGNEHPLEKGDQFFTAPRISHAQITDSTNPMVEYCLLLDIVPNKKRGSDETSFTSPLLSQPFSVTRSFLEMDNLLTLLNAETAVSFAGHKEMITSLIKSLLVLFIRNLDRFALSEHLTPSAPISTPERRKLIIDSRLQFDCKNVSVKSLSKELGLSEKQTARVIEQEYGQSFCKLRTKARLDSACNLLKSPDNHSIQTIADWVGYSSVGYFESCFKKAFGVSPSIYRQTLA